MYPPRHYILSAKQVVLVQGLIHNRLDATGTSATENALLRECLIALDCPQSHPANVSIADRLATVFANPNFPGRLFRLVRGGEWEPLRKEQVTEELLSSRMLIAEVWKPEAGTKDGGFWVDFSTIRTWAEVNLFVPKS